MIIRDDTISQALRSSSLLDRRTENLVRKYMPSKAAIADMTDILTALADPSRLKIVSALAVTEMCVTDLANILGINQTTLSHQLRLLRSANLVTCKKQGKVVFYSISNAIIHDLLLSVSRLALSEPPVNEFEVRSEED